MNENFNHQLLFVINPMACNGKLDWEGIIGNHFKLNNPIVHFFKIPKFNAVNELKTVIEKFIPTIIVAVGGDGTIKLVAESIIAKNIPIGIIPAGSANGMAMELGISKNAEMAMDLILKGSIRNIHAIQINDQICLHLSDIGMNAHAMKLFEKQQVRGFWGYLMASIKVLWKSRQMTVELKLATENVRIKAEIIIIANGTKYGTGAIINPIGNLSDNLFEVIVVKKISVSEIYKMAVSHQAYDPAKTLIFQTNQLLILSKKKVHFQIDGEYLGKLNQVQAKLIPAAIQIIC